MQRLPRILTPQARQLHINRHAWPTLTPETVVYPELVKMGQHAVIDRLMEKLPA
jgi:hypothetical protein